MYIDAPMRDVPLTTAADEIQRYERLGFDAVWTFETGHDPFFPVLMGAAATDRIGLGTNIAVAFARSPFATAMAAWDLQGASGGRFCLGLGTQVRAHVERRFSTEFEHPAARVTEYIECVRSIWNTFQTGARPAYEGRFYRFKLINDFFNPGPIEHPEIPIFLAGVNERMCRAAGEVADGFHVHPIHSPGYLEEVVRPALEDGAARRERSLDRFVVHAPVFVIVGDDEAERSKAERSVRQQVAFYASTPSYRRFLDFHGHADLGKKLSGLMREGKVAEMVSLVPDDLVEAVSVSGPLESLPAAIEARYAGTMVQRVSLYHAVPPGDDDDRWQRFTAGFERD